MNPATQNSTASSLEMSGGRSLSWASPRVMGILNVTPDSFSDGGSFTSAEQAVKWAIEMEEQGADIVDIGGESSRPGSNPVLADEENRRVIPVIEGIRKTSSIPISIDTCKASVAKEALEAGADIINDITALRHDPDMTALVASVNVPVILMHMLGTPKTMQEAPVYDDCVSEIEAFFEERLEWCQKSGIDTSRIIIDPGIGFGKRLQDNLEILARLPQLKRLGRPILVGTSRKSFINMVTGTEDRPRERIGGSIASMLTAVTNGANIVRVHDVAETVEALKVAGAIKDSK